MYRNKLLSFFMLVLLFMAVPVGIFFTAAYYKDPLYLFHAPKTEKFRLETNMRIQAAGIIHSFEFDSAILGTSMLRNTSARHCSKVLGGDFVNISLIGSSFWERDFVLSYLLEKKKISSVMYSLDNSYLTCAKDTQKYDPDNWVYLYDENRLNDFQVYLNKAYIKNIFFGVCKAKFNDLDMPTAWTAKWIFDRFGGIHNWVADSGRNDIKSVLTEHIPQLAQNASPDAVIRRDKEREALAKKYVEDHVLSFAAKHRETTFYLMFPPYWRYRFAEMRQYNVENFAIHQEVIRYTVNRAEKLGNVQVYGFEDCDFVDDVAKYMDTGHYHPDINKYMVESMGKGRHRLSSDMLEAYLARCDKLARAFDFKALDKEVKRLFAKKKEAQRAKKRKSASEKKI